MGLWMETGTEEQPARQVCADCGKVSHHGVLCRVCIEDSWPQAPVGDGIHWIVWKVVRQKTDRVYLGDLGAPYQIGEPTVFLGLANWLLSPLGALKEALNYLRDKRRILCAIVRADEVWLRDKSVVAGLSPALTLNARRLDTFPLSLPEASRLLDPRDRREDQIDKFERALRPELPESIALPPSFAAVRDRNKRKLVLTTCLSPLKADTGTLQDALRVWGDGPPYAINLSHFADTLNEKDLIRARQRTVSLVNKYAQNAQ